jgi:uncharacterized protein YndB with AHSA1/START domain
MNPTEALPMEREVTLVRTFDAPRDLVFRAWTEPKHLQQWWGPACWTNSVAEVDLRVGGAWKVVMRAPDGGEYPCVGIYREIDAPTRLVFTNDAVATDGTRLLDGLTTVLFEEEGGKTKLTLKAHAKGLVDYAGMMLKGMEMGWSQSLDRLVAAMPDFK